MSRGDGKPRTARLLLLALATGGVVGIALIVVSILLIDTENPMVKVLILIAGLAMAIAFIAAATLLVKQRSLARKQATELANLKRRFVASQIEMSEAKSSEQIELIYERLNDLAAAQTRLWNEVTRHDAPYGHN